MTECAVVALVIPLDRAALCVACDAVFELTERCPGCASEHVVSLGRWLSRDGDKSPSP